MVNQDAKYVDREQDRALERPRVASKEAKKYMEFGERIRSEVQRVQKYQEFMKVGVPSGFHGQPENGLEVQAREKRLWMDEKGFVTGLRSRFFHNGQSAWEVPEVANEVKDPYIAGAEEIGNEKRVRKVAKEMGFSMKRPQDFILATKKEMLHHYPLILNSNSLRSFEAKLYSEEVLKQKS